MVVFSELESIVKLLTEFTPSLFKILIISIILNSVIIQYATLEYLDNPILAGAELGIKTYIDLILSPLTETKIINPLTLGTGIINGEMNELGYITLTGGIIEVFIKIAKIIIGIYSTLKIIEIIGLIKKLC